jgi:hypothetical protein
MDEKEEEKENLEINENNNKQNEVQESQQNNIDKNETEKEKEEIIEKNEISKENTEKEEITKENTEKQELPKDNTNTNEDNTNEEISENIQEKKSSNLYEESKEPFMQVVTKELLTCLNDENNRKCFDCQTTPAYWVCVNNGIFLCSKCAGEHRGYGAIISNLKFIMLDKLNEFQIEIMKRGGNKKLGDLLEEYKIDKNKTDKLILYSYRLLEYHRNYLYNKLAGKDDPKPPSKFDSTKIMSNFKDNPRPPLEKIKKAEEIFKETDKNKDKDNKKGNCKVQ